MTAINTTTAMEDTQEMTQPTEEDPEQEPMDMSATANSEDVNEMDLASMSEDDMVEEEVIKMIMEEENKFNKEERLRRAEEKKKLDDEKYVIEMLRMEKIYEKKKRAEEKSREAKEKAAREAKEWFEFAEKFEEEELRKLESKEDEIPLPSSSSTTPPSCPARTPNPGAVMPPGMDPWLGRAGEDGQIEKKPEITSYRKEQEQPITSSTFRTGLGTSKDQREVITRRPLQSSRVLDAQGFKRQRQEQRRQAMSSSRNLEEASRSSPPNQEAPSRVRELARMFQTSSSPIKLPILPPASSTRSVASTISGATYLPSGESQPASVSPAWNRM